MKIDLPICMIMPFSARPFWQTVEAEIVDVAPHITVGTFAVHDDVRSIIGYHVTNIETGLSVSCADTPGRAIACARQRLSDKDDAFILRAYKSAPSDCRAGNYREMSA